MKSFRPLVVVLCAAVASGLVGCDRTKIADDKSDEISPGEGKAYIIPAQQKEHQIRVEVSADEEFSVDIGLAEGDKFGETLGKAEKTKSVKLEVKVPAGKEAIVRIRVEKKCVVKTSIRSI